jgi:hypothetical protein
MHKVVVKTDELDGVVQAPGAADEDTNDAMSRRTRSRRG